MNNIIDINLPRDNVNDEFVKILSKKFTDGDEIHKDDIIIEYETSKADVEFPSENDGFIKYFCEEGDSIKPGQLIIKIYPTLKIFNESNNQSINKKTKTKKQKTLYSKKALFLLDEMNIDKNQFSDRTFVTSNEIGKHNKNDVSKSRYNEIKNSENDLRINIDKKNNQKKINRVIQGTIDSKKKREIEYLSQVQKEGLVSSVVKSIKINNIASWTNMDSKYFQKSFFPSILFECSKLLKKYKNLNSYFYNDEIIFYENINIGFAIDLDNGLKVLTIYNADSKSFTEIESDIYTLSNKYLNDELAQSDLTDSTFTITDLSSEGTSIFTPLINKNQSAILGIGRFEDIINLIISFDHRITEGKYVSRFLSELALRIEAHFKNHIDENIICSKCFISLKEESTLSNLGLIKITKGNGREDFICFNCLSGV